MLSTLRKSASGFFAKALLLALAASFVLWGVGDVLRSSSMNSTLATVGKEKILLSSFMAEVDQLKKSFGQRYSPEFLQGLNIHQLKLQEMVNKLLLRQESENLGITVPDEAIMRNIRDNPAFHNANGAFDKSLFRQLLAQHNISEKIYIEDLRQQLTTELLLASFDLRSIVPDELLKNLYVAKHEQRKVVLLKLETPPQNSKIVEPSDAELANYYATNKSKYHAPEYRALGYVELLPAQIMSQVQVSRQDAMKIYNERVAEFSLPEKREIQQLLYDNKSDAERAYGLLRSGKNFNEVAKEIAPLNGKNLLFGTVVKEKLPVGGAAVFQLAKDEFSVPLESHFGWYIFKVTKIEPSKIAGFEEVRKNIENELRSEQADKIFSDHYDRLEDGLASGVGLEAAAKIAGVKYNKVRPINMQGKQQDNGLGLDADKNFKIISTVFGLNVASRGKQNTHSSVIRNDDGSAFVVELNDVIPARDRALEEIRGQVLSDWKQDEVKKSLHAAALKRADSLRAEIKAGKDFSLNDLSPLRMVLDRGGVSDDKAIPADWKSVLPQALIQEIFALPHAQNVTGIYPYGKGFVFAIYEASIAAPDASKTPRGKKLFAALQHSLSEDYHQEILDQYFRYLRASYGVKIHEDVLKTALGADKNPDAE